MTDEFTKGPGVLTDSGLVQLVLASWYWTTSFENTQQLIALLGSGAVERLFNITSVTLMGVFLRFALFGALIFWVFVPAGHQIMNALQRRHNAQ